MPSAVRTHRLLIAAGLSWIFLVFANPMTAADGPFSSPSSRTTRQEAMRAIPLDRLNAEDRAAVQAVLHRTSVYRRLPAQVIDCHPEIFTFLIRNPHVIANVWEVLNMSKLRMRLVADHAYQADDGHGTRGILRILAEEYGNEAQHRILLYGEGTYEGKPFLRPIPIRCVCLLRSSSIRETNGRHYILAQLDSFVAIDQTGLDLLAKTVHPLIGKVADYNFTETMRFVSSFSGAVIKNPVGAEHLAHRLTHISPQVRKELVALAYSLADPPKSRPLLSTAHTMIGPW